MREVSGLSRAVKSILIYLESTYGPMTSALTLSARKRSARSDDVRHTDVAYLGDDIRGFGRGNILALTVCS